MEPVIELKHRRPQFDFTGTPAHWSPHLEFGLFFVAASTGAPAVEPYLNRVMAQAKGMLKERDAHLKQDIEIFIKQETTHFQVHMKYNAEMARHYPSLVGAEEAKRKDYQSFLAHKSHKFNCAYAAGFETLALSMALFLFEEAHDLLANADPRTVAMWKWHLGEEYEHRAVCHEVYNAVYGDYFYRAKMVVFAIRHLGGHNKRVLTELLAHDRQGMTPEQLAASIKREKAFKRRFAAFNIPRILRLLTPGYSPRRVRAPPGLEEELAQYEAA